MSKTATTPEPRLAPVLEVENITVSYHGVTALEQVSFQLEHASICALVGINGSGKSTLFKAVMGFIKPSSGSVLVNGLLPRAMQKTGTVAYVPQAEEVDWSFPVSVKDVVMMGRYGFMGPLRIASKDDNEAVKDALELVGISHLAKRQIGELSGGQKKRTFLARAIAQQATVLLLDEPFSGVDITTQQMMIELLKRLRDEGKSVLISTHDLNSIKQFCDHALLLNRTVVATGSVDEIVTKENLLLTFGTYSDIANLTAGQGSAAS